MSGQEPEILHPSTNFGLTASGGSGQPIDDDVKDSGILSDIHGPESNGLDGPLFHCFISYRSATESKLAEEFHRQLTFQSRSGKRIPAGGLGTWPSFAQPPQNFGHQDVKVFLDKRCLMDGKSWEASFVKALAHSVVFCPLLSWHDKDGVNEGSVGKLLSLHHTDQMDNVLLELIIAIELVKFPGSMVRSILPIFVETKEDSDWCKFPMARLSTLPNVPSRVTNRKAIKVLERLGLPSDQLAGIRDRTVRQTIELLIQFQGLKMSRFEGERPAIEQCAGRTLELLIREVRQIQGQPTVVQVSKPHGKEMLEYLEAHPGLLCLAESFSSHQIFSLKQLSELNVEDVFKICSAAQCDDTENIGLKLELLNAIKQLKNHPLAQTLEHRLENFRDMRVAKLSAVTSRNAMEMVLQHPSLPFVFAIFGALQIFQYVTLFAMTPKVYVSGGEDLDVIPWGRFLFGGLGNLGRGVLLSYVGYLAAIHRTHAASRMIFVTFIFTITTSFLQCVVDAVQILAGQHDESVTFASAFALGTSQNDSLVYGTVLCAVLAIIYRQRQEYFLPAFACFICFVLGYFGVQHLQDSRYALSIMFFCMVVPLVLIFFSLATFKYNAVALSSKQKELDRLKYDNAWRTLLGIDPASNVATNPAARVRPQSEATENSSKELRELNEMSRQIEFNLVQERTAALSQRTLLQKLFEDPAKGVGRFSVTGKARQKSRDLDTIYAQASLLVDAVQDYMLSLLQSITSTSHSVSFRGDRGSELHLVRGPVKQPFRSLEKIVRVYRRDSSMLTDIVRCTILANKVDHLLQFMQKIHSLSVIGVNSSTTDADRDKMFRIVQLKNRFDDSSKHYDTATGYRDIALNLEVGIVVQNGNVVFLPVPLWEQRRALRHIFEVQVHLGPLHQISQGGHKTYEQWRDLLAM